MRSRRSKALSMCAIAVALMLGAARCPSSALDDAVANIARTQGVEQKQVRTLLGQAASSEEGQLKVANQWEAQLPNRPVPDLNSRLDDFAAYGREQLKEATCSALVDMANTGEIPSGREFVLQYLIGLPVDLPNDEVAELMNAFDSLVVDTIAGNVTATEVRVALLKLKYC